MHMDSWLSPTFSAAAGVVPQSNQARQLGAAGEPGAGKTTAFTDLIPEAEHDHPPLPRGPGALWLTGDELESRAAVDDCFGRYIDALRSKP